LEIAIRCHSIVAVRNATLQFPEITLGILPGIGGCIVPYRKWPHGAGLFHEMICLGKPLTAQKAAEIGMIARLEDDYEGMIKAAIEEVHRLAGNIQRMAEGKVDIPPITIADEPDAPATTLSREAIAITVKTIQEGAKTENFSDALEIGYNGFGEIACTDAAKEGISSFLERRKPTYKK
jgi:enoyl-CoA hydratase/3-hydroxyacyl-CoA dehydrogenase